MIGLWFLASSLGGVLAGLFGGEATSTGLDSMTPIFSELVYYYLVLAVVLIVLSFDSEHSYTVSQLLSIVFNASIENVL